MCIPLINLGECLKEDNVNMVTCSGQAITPLAKVLMEFHPDIKYMEIVSSLSSYSAGIGTRDNIDEFTQTTKEVLEELAGVPKAKAIIILNPAQPPIIMQNTLYAKIKHSWDWDMKEIQIAINAMVDLIKKYVPGYELILGPIYEKEEQRLTLMIKCKGQGDFLPEYAGNLDIITAAAVKVAEEYAKKN
jgi:acetaldehyde dehydrogenase